MSGNRTVLAENLVLALTNPEALSRLVARSSEGELLWACAACDMRHPVDNEANGSDYEVGDWEPCTECSGTAEVVRG